MPDVENINQPKTKKWLFVTAIAAILLVASLAIIYIPQIQAGLYKAQVSNAGELTKAERIQLEKDAVDFANKARLTLAQAIGGLFILGTIGVALWNAKIAQDNARAALQNAQAAQTNAETAQKNLKLAEETAQKNLQHLETSKITERFSKAIELLGSDKMDVRIGAIYALERIALDSQPDHWTVMEVLATFVRKKSQKDFSDFVEPRVEEGSQGKIANFANASDIEAAITVIGRRKWWAQEKPHQQIDLTKAYLPKIFLANAHLKRAILSLAHLKGATLIGTNLEDAHLIGTHLEEAHLSYACLKGADFRLAYLSKANFEHAKGVSFQQLSSAYINGKPLNLTSDLDIQWDEEKKRRDEELEKPTPPKSLE